MANDSLKNIEIMFENFVEGYDAACVLSNAVDKETIGAMDAQRSGDVQYVRQNYEASTVSGLDISAATAMDVIDRAVPITFSTPQNVFWKLDAKEYRDPLKMQKQGEAAAISLAALVDNTLYQTGVTYATMTQVSTAALAWGDAASAETAMVLRGIVGTQPKLFMNATDYQSISSVLATAAYKTDWNKTAYERAQVPDMANFMSFRTDNVINVTAKGTVTGTTINGAQSYTPTAKDANGIPTDNRKMTLTVQGANVANIKAGDRFTIAGVNAVHMKTKSDTGTLQTFTVLSTASSGTSLTITPAIVSSGPYQNVSAAAANSAAVTFINSVTKPANLFFSGSALQLKYGQLAFPTDMGPKVMTATTKNGAPLTMSYSFDHLTGVCTARFHVFFGAAAVDPEKIGIILANQT